MYPVRTQRSVPADALALRELAAQRQSHWLSVALAWAGGLVGCLSVLILVAGVNQASTLPRAARPGVGPGFSESATATFGAMLFGGGFACLAFVLVGLALLHARKRLRTLAFAVPAVVGTVLLVTVSHWAPR